MKRLIRVFMTVLLLTALCSLTACQKEEEGLGGVRVTPEMLESVSQSLEQATATTPEEEAQATTAPSIVYWTAGGTVYHVKETCSAIKNSTEIHSGSVSDAQAAKKERVCKSCSK